MKDIFSFFELPARPGPQIEAGKVLRAEALALGFEIDWTQDEGEARWLGPDAIVERSHGEVKKPETINYRTFLPEYDGLFCARIFGPVRDYECLCGKYKRMKHRGVVCDECGVEVIQSKVRRERFGHMPLAAPVLHPWLLAPIGRLLAMSEGELRERGGDGVRAMLERVDLSALAAQGSERGRLARALEAAELAPKDLVVTVVPVLPPDLRPLVPLDGGRFATSDLNDLYRRLLNRNNRTRRLIELNAPEQIIVNEQQMLQNAYEHLVHNHAMDEQVTGPNKRRLRCLSSMIAQRGTTNLIGKRVDYSGVAALVVDRQLAEGECRLPRTMALELFKPFIYSALEAAGHVTTIKSAKKLVESAIDALHEGTPIEPAPPTAQPPPNPNLHRHVDELEISVATANALQNASITTIAQLVQRTEAELLKTKSFGRKSLKEIKEILFELGLHLGMPVQGAPPPQPADRIAVVLDRLEEITRGYPVVLANEERVVARDVTLWDHPAIAVSPSTAGLLSDRWVAVHVPLTDQARDECRGMPDDASPAEREESGWLTELLYGASPAEVLVRGAIEGEVDPLDDPVVRLALGLAPD